MKTKIIALSLGCALVMPAFAQFVDPATNEEPAAVADAEPAAEPPVVIQVEPPPPQEEAPPAEATPPQNQEPANAPVAPAQTQTVQTQIRPAPPIKAQSPATTVKPVEGSKPAETMSTPSTPAHVVAEGERGLRLNFRGAPLELVLDYLSEAAGFIIRPEVDVKGKIDVWSNQPLTKDEAVELLNSVLNKNGYAALRDGRTLTIVTWDEAKRRYIPVKSGSEPASIPKNDEIVTQIIPVRFINAVQLTKDLQPLLPAQATMTANEGGNALVITDTQINIRRMAEIIKALDTSIASVSAVRVFALRYADAKSLADVIKEVFQTQTSSASDARARFFARFRGGPFDPPGGGDTGSDTGSSGGRPGAARVAAVADERSNSLVVSAPDDLMPTIEELVKSVDVNVEDATEVRVFRLKYADPQEMADLLSGLFPDQTGTQTTQGGRFGRFFNFGGPGQGANTATDQSDRMKKQGKVVAVPDARTGSVVVSAARDLMVQIAKMIEDLDSDPAKKTKVFVFDVQNTDPQQVQSILQGLFPSQNYGTVGSTRTASGQTGAGNQLNTRASQTQGQNVNRSTSSGGSSGFGTGTGTTGR